MKERERKLALKWLVIKLKLPLSESALNKEMQDGFQDMIGLLMSL